MSEYQKSDPPRAECQICGRAIAHDAFGVLAHHGYQRPSNWHGVQTASCLGARELSYELSNRIVVAWVSRLDRLIVDRQLVLREAQGWNQSLRVWHNKTKKFNIIERGEPGTAQRAIWEREKRWGIAQNEQAIAGMQQEREHFQKRADAWFPRPLVTMASLKSVDELGL